jgi:hypothetical protein
VKLQGFFDALAYGLTKSVWDKWRSKLCCRKISNFKSSFGGEVSTDDNLLLTGRLSTSMKTNNITEHSVAPEAESIRSSHYSNDSTF